jgi:PAS domain S-box-containing protein
MPDYEELGKQQLIGELQKVQAQAEEVLSKKSHELNERRKEMGLLYRVSAIIENREISLEEIAQRVVDLIPAAWQYPEVTAARVTLDGKEYKTANFRESNWRQASDIVIYEKEIGSVEIVYLEARPQEAEGPFLQDERRLLDSLAQRLGNTTERKQSEKALRKSEKYLQFVADHAPVSIAHCDLEKRYKFVNNAYAEMFGLQSSDVVGKYIQEIVGEEAFVHSLPFIETALLGQSTKHDRELPTTSRVVSVHYTPENDGTGRVVGFIAAISDITERLQAEQQLQQSESRFRKIIETSPIPYALIDNNQNITYLNNAFIQVFGYSLRDIPTLADWWSKAYPDSDYRQWNTDAWQARQEQTEREHPAFTPLEIEVHCKDGMKKTVLASASTISKSFSDVHLVILYDITERKQMESEHRKLLKAEAMLSEEREKRVIYIATVSSAQHILNNLLNNMMLFKMKAEKADVFDDVTKTQFEYTISQGTELVKKLSAVEVLTESNIKASVYPKSDN